MHAEGSVRALLDDIPEMTRSISCSDVVVVVVVVVTIVCGPDIGAVVDGSKSVEQKAPVD